MMIPCECIQCLCFLHCSVLYILRLIGLALNQEMYSTVCMYIVEISKKPIGHFTVQNSNIHVRVEKLFKLSGRVCKLEVLSLTLSLYFKVLKKG